MVMMVDEEDTELPSTDCLLGAPVFVVDANDAMDFDEAVVGPQESKSYQQFPKLDWIQM
jgi:hypothetical protein